MKRNRDKYGRGSAAANGAGFVDLEPGDTFAGLESRLRLVQSVVYENSTLGISASIISRRNANELAKHMAPGEGEEPHKFAAKNVGILFSRGTVGIRHFDKKAVRDDTPKPVMLRVFSPFVFGEDRLIATITLRQDKDGNKLYAIEALEINKSTDSERTPRGETAPLQNQVLLLKKRIAYYVGDVNRTKPTFQNRSEPFSQERVAELLANHLVVESNDPGAASTVGNLRRHSQQISIRTAIGWMVAMVFAWKRRGVIRKMRGGWRLPVVFHALSAEEFGRILDWFAARGVVNKLDLSMDDGWRCVKDYLPHLKRHGVRAKLYIAPGETARGSVWTDVAIRRGVPCEEWRLWYGLNEADRYARLEKELELRVGVGERRLISKEEVIELAKTGLIDVENHTWSHVSATSRPVDEVMDEVRRAQDELTAWTGRAPEYLAWPFGRGNAELDERARQMGLKTVYTKNLPEGRSMAIENVTFQENIGRLLGAWPRVGETL